MIERDAAERFIAKMKEDGNPKVVNYHEQIRILERFVRYIQPPGKLPRWNVEESAGRDIMYLSCENGLHKLAINVITEGIESVWLELIWQISKFSQRQERWDMARKNWEESTRSLYGITEVDMDDFDNKMRAAVCWLDELIDSAKAVVFLAKG